MQDYVFISYARVDEALVRRLYNDLKAQGINCWLDVEQIPSGADWDYELQKAIQNCNHFLIVCTPNSMKSRNVQAEWQYAFDLRHSIHPLVLETCEIPFRLRIYQHIDAISLGYENALQELLNVLPTTHHDQSHEPVTISATSKVDALLKRAVENWRSFGLLIDRDAFKFLDQTRHELQIQDADAAEVLFLSARRNLQSYDYWLQVLHLHETALDRVEDHLIDQIDETFSYERLEEFYKLRSGTLLKKVARLIEITQDLSKLAALLNAFEKVLTLNSEPILDIHVIETALLNSFEQRPNLLTSQALGWINSIDFLCQALALLSNATFEEAVDKLIYLRGLVYMTHPDAIAYLKAITPPGFVCIPAGWFTMGQPTEREPLNVQHDVFVPTFWLSKTLVSKHDMEKSIISTDNVGRLPAQNVSWLQAQSYLLQIQERSKLPYNLPTEAMWEKAASWDPVHMSKLRFPWGNEEDPTRCNTIESGLGRISTIGLFSPRGDSPYGVCDMVGNVWEWTSSIWKPYPYHPRDGREAHTARLGIRTLRGSSYKARRGYIPGCVTRASFEENYAFEDAGFRIAIVVGT